MELVISLCSDLTSQKTHRILVTKISRLCLEGTSEHGNEPSGSIKGGEFFD
jgi:hypothetical protein